MSGGPFKLEHTAKGWCVYDCTTGAKLAEAAHPNTAIREASRVYAKFSERKRKLLEYARNNHEPPSGTRREGFADMRRLLDETLRKNMHAAVIYDEKTGEVEWHRRTGGGKWSKSPPLTQALDSLERSFAAPENKRTRTIAATKKRRSRGVETRQRVLAAATTDSGPTRGRIKRIAKRAGVSPDYAGRILKGSREKPDES